MPYKDPEKRRENNAAAVRRWQARNPEKVRANQARQHAKAGSPTTNPKRRARLRAQKAVQRGRLTPEPCLFCGREQVQAHHHDYSKPLDVTWLCSRHHGLVHRTVQETHHAA